MGLFGHFGAVEITFMEEIGSEARIRAGSLPGGSRGCYGGCALEGKTLFLSGSVLETLAAWKAGRRALPGAMLVLRA